MLGLFLLFPKKKILFKETKCLSLPENVLVRILAVIWVEVMLMDWVGEIQMILFWVGQEISLLPGNWP